MLQYRAANNIFSVLLTTEICSDTDSKLRLKSMDFTTFRQKKQSCNYARFNICSFRLNGLIFLISQLVSCKYKYQNMSIRIQSSYSVFEILCNGYSLILVLKALYLKYQIIKYITILVIILIRIRYKFAVIDNAIIRYLSKSNGNNKRNINFLFLTYMCVKKYDCLK